MNHSVFREYDIRGIVEEDFCIDEVYSLAKAIAYYFVQNNPAVKTVVVGIDGRTHSPKIGHDVCRALCDSGLQVLFLGSCATPMIYFALHTLPVQAGIMITASHNPKEYNGMKICLGTESVHGQEIQKLYALYKSGAQLISNSPGTITEYSISKAYIDYMISQFPDLVGLSLSVSFDCGNGAAGVVLPELIKQFGWKNTHILYPQVDGTFPNHEADPVVEKNMKDLAICVQQNNSDVGIGFDGDADRMGALTAQGNLVSGDMLMALFAQPLIEKQKKGIIVYNVLASSGLIDLIRSWGGDVILVPAGHSNIKKAMKIHHALLGGESSCHFCFADTHFGYDDGIYAALRLCQILVHSKKSLATLLQIFPKRISSPEYRITCEESIKQIIIDAVKNAFEKRSDMKLLTVDGVRAETEYGWGIIRKSNTQPVLSMRFESNTVDGYENIKNDFIVILADYFDEKVLQEIKKG